MRSLARWGASLAVPALAACATLPPPQLPEVAECRANYLGLEEKIQAAGVRNGGAWRIPGFPYLRSDRFLASFRNEVADGAPFQAWVERLRQLDLEARVSELRNLGWLNPAEELRHLDRCGKEWATRDLADPARAALLRQSAAVPDDYSLMRRVLGFYPVAVPFLNLGISRFNDAIRRDYATPAERLPARAPLALQKLLLWRPEPPRVPASEAAEWLATAQDDPLKIPALTDKQWERLARAHLPLWLIETAGEFDQPGAVVLRNGPPGVDAFLPVTYWQRAFTRFGDKVLAQLVYVVWFSERPKEGAIDPYAGKLDGLVWRVTLDTDGKPLLYDTIHACGCYHYYYRAKPLARRPQGGFWDEPVLFPQEAPREPFAVRLQSGTHYVRRLIPMQEVAAEARAYFISAYSELLSLPAGDGKTRSLFREDGIVEGTSRMERLWLWPAGIKDPGAMRQWGRQATSFVGRSHFDDPEMLDRLFGK